jgi:nitrogen-specific signal transduction histidine kinase
MVALKPSDNLAAVEPTPPDELSEQADFFASYSQSQIVPDRVSDLLLVLNQQRQITYANRAAREFLEDGQPSDILGHLLGGVLRCVHAEEGNGCGTTETCQLCGANKTIRRCLTGVEELQECRISRRDGEALDLLVWGSPMWFQENVYALLTIRDISHEKRRRALERIFFHDVLNTATGIMGYADLLDEALSPDEEELAKDLLAQLANRLVEEIKSQRILLDAENDDLVITPGTVYSLRACLKNPVE